MVINKERSGPMKRLASFLLVILITFPLLVSANASTEVAPSTVISMIYAALVNDNEIEYDVQYNADSNMYNISVQRDGIALAAVLAENDSSYLEQWYSMRDNLGSLCTSLLNLVKTITSEDSAFVSISLMNDQNTDMVLLTILNSVVVYDSVDGTDLLGA